MGKPVIGLIFKYGEPHAQDQKYLAELKDVRGCKNLEVKVLDWRYTPENPETFFNNLPNDHKKYCASEYCKVKTNKPYDQSLPELQSEADNYYKYTTGLTLDESVDNYLKTIDAIYIPGGAFDLKEEYCADKPKKPAIDIRREEFERELVKKAIKNGIPVMGICAGSWLVASCYEGVKTKELEDEGDKKVFTMHRQDLPQDAKRVTNNPNVADGQQIPGLRSTIHQATIKTGTMLHGIVDKAKEWKTKEQRSKSIFWEKPKVTKDHKANPLTDISLGVNSTHWRVIVTKEGKIDDNNLLVISAIEPEHQTIEGFESRFGVPIVGIQFHPEYRIPVWITDNTTIITPDPDYVANRRILEGLAEAALTHSNKKAVTEEIKSTCKKSS